MIPKISVVMSTYNETKLELHDSIVSILNQSYSNFEFIIIDDNPYSLKLKNYLLKIRNQYNNVIIIFNRTNLGASQARNRGIKISCGDYIAIMDADDKADKYRLQEQLDFLLKNNLDFVFPNYKFISVKGNILKKQNYHISSIINQHEITYIFKYINNISINSGWLVKRSLFKNLKGYRNLSVEDYDFIARAIIYGYKLGYQNKVLMSVRLRKNSVMRTNALNIYLTTRYIKHYFRLNQIFSMNTFNGYIYNNLSDKNVRNFNNFIVSFLTFRYNLNVRNGINFLFHLLKTKFSLKFMFTRLTSSLRRKFITYRDV